MSYTYSNGTVPWAVKKPKLEDEALSQATPYPSASPPLSQLGEGVPAGLQGNTHLPSWDPNMHPNKAVEEPNLEAKDQVDALSQPTSYPLASPPLSQLGVGLPAGLQGNTHLPSGSVPAGARDPKKAKTLGGKPPLGARQGKHAFP